MELEHALYLVFNVDTCLSPLLGNPRTKPVRLGSLTDVRGHLPRAPLGAYSYDVYSVQETTAPDGETLRGERKTPVLTNQPLPLSGRFEGFDEKDFKKKDYLSYPIIDSFDRAEERRRMTNDKWDKIIRKKYSNLIIKRRD